MLHGINPVIKHQLGLLHLLEELSNVFTAYKIIGIFCDMFYYYRELTDEGRVDLLINFTR